MSDWLTCKNIACKSPFCTASECRKNYQFSFVLCLRYHLTHQIRRKRKFDFSDHLQWGHNCHMDLSCGLLLLLCVFWHRPIGGGMLTGQLVGKHFSGVIRGIATGLILEHSCWDPLHPAFTRWYEMNPFSSSGSFIKKSRIIILPNILGKEGIRNGKIIISCPFHFFFLFISVWNNIVFKAGIQSSMKPGGLTNTWHLMFAVDWEQTLSATMSLLGGAERSSFHLRGKGFITESAVINEV